MFGSSRATTRIPKTWDELEARFDEVCDAGPALTDLPGIGIGANAYYLQEEATRHLRRVLDVDQSNVDSSCSVVEEVFTKLSALGVSWVRTFAFNDDPAKAGDSAIQTAPGVHDEVALRGLDLVLSHALERGVKLVLCLGNHWNEYGGARQYLRWAGRRHVSEGDRRFYTDLAVREMFRNYVTTLMQRTNTFDGFTYGSHPAVWAFELLNEPRSKHIGDWIDDVGGSLRALISPEKLILVGEEGFEQSYQEYSPELRQFTSSLRFPSTSGDFTQSLQSSVIDLGSVHFYPDVWGISQLESVWFGALWMRDHCRIARKHRKGLLVGEFGLPNIKANGGAKPLSLGDRRRAYAYWFLCAKRLGVTGIAPWMFAYDARPDEWDRYTFYYQSGTNVGDEENRYAEVIRAAANHWSSVS